MSKAVNEKWKKTFPDTIGNQNRPATGVDDTQPFETGAFPQYIANDPVRYDLQNAAMSQSMSNDARLKEMVDARGKELDDHKVDPGAHKTGIAGNAATATKVVANAAAGKSANIAEATMAGSDSARIRVSGDDNAGELALETADNGDEAIVARQYTGDFKDVVRMASILDTNGNTSFPGTVVAPKFTGALNGNAATATKLETARTISLSGKAAGSTTFDGTTDTAIKVTSVNADTASKLSDARKINITGNATGAAAFDGSGDVSINVNVSQSAHSDTADTATKLETARNITLAGNATGSATFDGTGDITIDTTVAEAAHADKATNDGAGDEITTKYVSSVTIDNATLTVTKGDKTATELTLPSYTHPNSGISAGLDEWTGITFDAQGHATATTYPTRLTAYNHGNSNVDFQVHYKDESKGLQSGGYYLDGAALPDNGNWIKILTDLDNFDTGHSLGGNGYQKFRSGLILQWGYVGSAVSHRYVDCWYPIAFNNVFCVFCTMIGQCTDGGDNGSLNINWYNNKQANFYNTDDRNGTGFFWFAIGN